MSQRILVIDDNPAIHADIRKILIKGANANATLEEAEELLFGEEATPAAVGLDFEIDSAYQGQDGFEKVKQALAEGRPYALAFIDVRMPPGWDGIETISRIWEVYPELQVVVCTAYSDYSWEEMTRKVKKSDSVLILKKPFDNIEVLQMAHALTKKWALTQEAKTQLSTLDTMVAQRTAELQHANGRLTNEIAERTQAERELRLSKERFAKAFRSSPIPMSIQSIGGHRFLDVNDAYLQMTGFDRGDVVGQNAFEIGVWPNPESRRQIFDELRSNKSIRNLEANIRTKDGQERFTLLSAEVIELAKEEYALISEHDISQRLQLEAQLRQAQKMQAIGHLAAGVAHDFRNVLTVIQGHSNLRLLDRGLDSKVVASFEEITAAVERASKLTRQLLAFSRKQIIQPQAADLNDLIKQLSSMLTRLIGENIDFKCHYAVGLPAIEADVCSVEQVVMNLVVNARDAMPKGGRLTIKTSVVSIDDAYTVNNPEAAPGDFVSLEVADTGCGMDESTKQRLFEPFFTTKEVGKGTGMGLATSYGIVKQHNGWIEVESAPDKGTTFRVYLPASQKAVQPAEKKTTLPGNFRGKEMILVVEDEEPVRRFVSELLLEYGYEVRLASNGVEALKVWKDHGKKIDLLLTDVVMPEEISGVHLADRLKAEKQNLKVIYTSGYSMELLHEGFQSRQNVNFLPKPYHPMKLAETVRTCLDS
jgi:two-component system, cell cycle sensor histidine kinase and response regulator CckA